MDPVALSIMALVFSPILGVVTAIITSSYSRRSAREGREDNRFEIFMRAAETRMKRLEEKVAELEASKAEQAREIANLTNENLRLGRIGAAQNRYIKKLLGFISKNLPDIERHLYEADYDDLPYTGQAGGVSRTDPPLNE